MGFADSEAKIAEKKSFEPFTFGFSSRVSSQAAAAPLIVQIVLSVLAVSDSWSKRTRETVRNAYTRDMKKFSFFVLASLSVLAACAPASGPGSEGFPVDRSKRWVLAYSPSAKNPANFYWIDFSKDSPEKNESLYMVEATATVFAKGSELNSTFAYASDGKILFASIFVSSSRAVNCALRVNNDLIPAFQPNDWVGLGDLGSPSNFFKKLRSESNDLESCVMIDATRFADATAGTAEFKIPAALRQQIFKRAQPVTQFDLRR